MDLSDVQASCQVQIGSPALGAGVTASISGTWVANKAQQQAAWEMYVELVTRITIVGLTPEQGLLREALASIHSLFPTTRDILRRYGPTVAQRQKGSDLSFGEIAIFVLNNVLRPVLTKWHPLLEDYEAKRPEGMSRFEHEARWEKNQELRQVLEQLRPELSKYAECLANVAGISPMIQGST